MTAPDGLDRAADALALVRAANGDDDEAVAALMAMVDHRELVIGLLAVVVWVMRERTTPEVVDKRIGRILARITAEEAKS